MNNTRVTETPSGYKMLAVLIEAPTREELDAKISSYLAQYPAFEFGTFLYPVQENAPALFRYYCNGSRSESREAERHKRQELRDRVRDETKNGCS